MYHLLSSGHPGATHPVARYTFASREVGGRAIGECRSARIADAVPPDKERNMLGFIIGLIVVGLIAGFIARALVPGRDPMSIGQTLLLGIVGSFVGGFLGWLLFGHDLDEGALQASGIIGSIVGAIVVLFVYNAVTHRDSALR
jgi:uncharacterized membrane protein YeaQ/YmgE (transglycosylase-associated protein family)